VSVKPHASPVLHAINYLLGELDPKYLTTLREFGGLQSYPSRSKDPDPVDYSTGSVGIGATAWILDQAFPADRSAPLVTVLDGHPHTLAFLASVKDATR
jgi:pyruvate dehydrogenase complex dehydrogenase (E1) component